jgi:two-component sensor histidine kinase
MVTTFVGLWGGITTAVLGGLLAWSLFFNPLSWTLDNQAWIPLLGYAVVAAVILMTSELYRSSERRHYERDLARAQAQADAAQLFARELAHRLGNTLAIVQAVAFQTIGEDTPAAQSFAGRLKTLSDANNILAEHVTIPTAKVSDVVETALKPFSQDEERFNFKPTDAVIASQQVLTLSLALHELGTNASKYGALSTHSGSVRITVDDAGDSLRITWKESGGPPVAVPLTQGFGTKLLRRIGVNAELEFEQDGLRCSFDVRKAPLG